MSLLGVERTELVGPEATPRSERQEVTERASLLVPDLVHRQVTDISGRQGARGLEAPIERQEHRDVLPAVKRQDHATVESESAEGEVEEVIAVDQESAHDWRDESPF